MARRIFTIPLVPEPQDFEIQLAGKALRVVNRWNGLLPAWCIDIYDGKTGAPLLLCMPLVTGVDLLAQHPHIDLPGGLLCATDGDLEAAPTETNLGTSGNLYFVVSQ